MEVAINVEDLMVLEKFEARATVKRSTKGIPITLPILCELEEPGKNAGIGTLA